MSSLVGYTFSNCSSAALFLLDGRMRDSSFNVSEALVQLCG